MQTGHTSTLLTSHSEQETIAAGSAFAERLKSGDVVACYGELGSGKTRFIKGICRGLGIEARVTSPTFTIVNEYTGPSMAVFHFDFYRIEQQRELLEIGFEEYLQRGGVCLIEWAERVEKVLPEYRYDVHLAPGESESDRVIRIDDHRGAFA